MDKTTLLLEGLFVFVAPMMASAWILLDSIQKAGKEVSNAERSLKNIGIAFTVGISCFYVGSHISQLF